jgi:RNA-directed DNA polymerase
MHFPTEAGTPQGGIISPTLANLTLDRLEQLLKQTFRLRKIAGKMHNPKVNFVRYADDFIITGSSKELLESEVKPLARRAVLARTRLAALTEKICITHFEDGFDFLGQNLRRHGGKVLTTPSKENLHAFFEKARGVIRKDDSAKQVNLIGRLNQVIRGWAN